VAYDFAKIRYDEVLAQLSKEFGTPRHSPNLGDDWGEAGGPFDVSLTKETSDGKVIAELTLSPPE
jgi:hypothetical protein